MAEIKPLTMPKFGLAMTEGTVQEWHKAEGETVAAGEELVDIETTKITNAFESPVAGTLRRQVVAPGGSVPVGALIGVLADPAVPEAEIDAFVADFQERFVPEAEVGEGGIAGPEARLVETAYGTINVFEAGEGAGPPVVFIHGFGGDLNNWMFVQPELARARHTVALDLPGHGGSTKQVARGDTADLAAALEAVLDALSLETAHIVGHSLGGAVALDLAGRSPRRVAALTLLAPAGLGPEINMDYVTGFLTAKRRKQMKPVLELLFADPGLVGRDMVEDVLKFKRLDGVAEALGAIAARSFADGRQAVEHRSTLAALDQPVQVIWGADDRILPADHAVDLPGHVAVKHLPETGHMAQMEQAREVAGMIAALASPP